MRLRIAALTILLLLTGSLIQAGNNNSYPLPEERGTAGTLAALQRLPVYARVLHTIAHPDDESAGTITWLSRKMHARTALFSLTRGEGGQNILGRERYEAMGLLRTGEFLEACRFYGVELYFSTAFDFGFSKNAEETLSKWGYEATLEETVRFIRKWRPAVIISRFQGNESDGHGHHQAAGVVTLEAFRAAGDPQRFTEQFKDGLQPWQAKKLYHGVRGSPEAAAGDQGARPEFDWTVKIASGEFDPVLGRSYREIGAEGYSKHRSQGTGAAFSLPGEFNEYYRLIDSTVGVQPKEDSFFDSMDISLLAIAELAEKDEAAAPFLRSDLSEAQRSAESALQAFDPFHPERSAADAARGAAVLARLIRKVENSQLSPPVKVLLEDALREKLEDFQDAVNATLGVYLAARADNPTLVPGQKESVTVYFYNRGAESIDLNRISLLLPEGWMAPSPPEAHYGKIEPGSSTVVRFSVAVPSSARITQPFLYRDDRNDARYKVMAAGDGFAPSGGPEISAHAMYRFRETEISIAAPARAQAGDAIRGSDFVDLQVVPALSVALTPEFAIAPTSRQSGAREFQVSVINNVQTGARGTVRVLPPPGWPVEPEEMPFDLSRKGETYTANFLVGIPPETSAGTFVAEAVAAMGNQEFRQGYRVVSYPENWTRNLYEPSRAVLEVFDLEVPPRLTIGYIMGAGDDVPPSLEQLGVNIRMLSGADLAFGDLSRLEAIVTGIRAYNVNEDLKANNQRLLAYVEQGGVLIVQYNTPERGRSVRSDGSPFPYAPYPIALSSGDRITVEESPLTILEPGHPIFRTPNRITSADFDNWVQERGLYFASSWDSRYTALLSGNDPGEKAQNGGMLVARYGKGYYVYTAYSWFRQLPAGVPGAFRIFANMLSLGSRN